MSPKKNLSQKIIPLIAIAILLTSCSIRIFNEHYYYDDIISDFSLSDDGKNILFFGQKYYYAVDFSNQDKLEEIKALLSWKKKSKLHYAVDMMVDKNNKIHGVANLEIYLRDIDDDDADFLKKYNFFRRTNYLAKQVVFRGTRIAFGPSAEYQARNAIFTKYQIRVRHETADFF
jgi:hypothetical protein